MGARGWVGEDGLAVGEEVEEKVVEAEVGGEAGDEGGGDACSPQTEYHFYSLPSTAPEAGARAADSVDGLIRGPC